MKPKYSISENQGGFRCNECSKWYKHRKSARRHIKRKHSENIELMTTVAETVSDSEMEIEEPHTSTSGPQITNRDADLEHVYEVNDKFIRTFVKEKSILALYNYKTTAPDFSQLLDEIFAKQKTAFKLNVEIGCVLWDDVKKIYSIFYASANTALFDKPLVIENMQDLEDAKDLCKVQFERAVFLAVRPNTKYVFREVTNVLFRVFKLNEVPIGMPKQCENDSIPDYIKKLRSIASFINRSDGVRYTDQLCFFRCLAGKLEGKYQNVDTRAKNLLDRWCQYKNLDKKDFKGIKMSQLTDLEHCFEINIFVYTLEKLARRGITGQFKRRSLQKYRSRLDLLLHDNHFSWIMKLHQFAKNYRCHCGTFFEKHYHFNRHVLTCDVNIKTIYPGGGYGSPPTVFQEMRDLGVEVEDEIFPFRIFYDFENRFEPAPSTSAGGNLHYSKELIPASFSIISNIPGQDIHGRTYSDVQFFASEDPQILIDQFFEYANDMALEGGRIMRTKYTRIRTILANEVEKGLVAKTQLNHARDEQEINRCQLAMAKSRQWEELSRKFDKWLGVVPILGFNSGRFDFALIRKYLIPCIFERGEKIHNVIRKGNSYLSISLENMQFIDIINYLAPGTNYQKFLTAYGRSELGSKSKWPYSYFDSFDRLKETCLPPRSAFFSDLRQKNDVTEEDYEDLRQEWERQGWQNLGDMLRYYNNQDCAPGLEAIENLSKLSADFGIDMFKNAVSVPGVAMRLMFSRQGETIYQIFDQKTKRWEKLIKESVVGGPSLVFTRYHEAGVTRIGISEVKAILGYDANALYLYCTAKEMPTGIGAEWTPSDNSGTSVPTSPIPDCEPEILIEENLRNQYERRSTVKYQQEHVWIMYQFKKLLADSAVPITIRHQYNGGQKMFYLPGGRRARVDGWIPEMNLVLEFQGCFYHGHICQRNNPKQQKWIEIAAARRERTRKRIIDLKALGLTVIEGKECEIDQLYTTDLDYKQLRQKHVYIPCSKTGVELIEMIKAGELFGFEVDIQVPWWKPELREYMKEMPPIFKNTDVTLDDIGDVMKSYALRNKLVDSRILLIGSYHATKMVFPTPVLKFYLDLGLVITRIYKALQFTPERSFKFVEEIVTENRRKADSDPEYIALGETSKLYGNSCYGRCLMAVEKHTKTSFMGEKKASKAINSRWFRDCELISDDIYQVDTAKSTVTYELPILIAFFVYGYAKIRILDFYFNFLLKILHRQNFALMQMDTDSLYLAIVEKDLESAIRPECRELYEQLKPLYLPCTEAGTDNRTPGLFKFILHEAKESGKEECDDLSTDEDLYSSESSDSDSAHNLVETPPCTEECINKSKPEDKSDSHNLNELSHEDAPAKDPHTGGALNHDDEKFIHDEAIASAKKECDDLSTDGELYSSDSINSDIDDRMVETPPYIEDCNYESEPEEEKRDSNNLMELSHESDPTTAPHATEGSNHDNQKPMDGASSDDENTKQKVIGDGQATVQDQKVEEVVLSSDSNDESDDADSEGETERSSSPDEAANEVGSGGRKRSLSASSTGSSVVQKKPRRRRIKSSSSESSIDQVGEMVRKRTPPPPLAEEEEEEFMKKIPMSLIRSMQKKPLYGTTTFNSTEHYLSSDGEATIPLTQDERLITHTFQRLITNTAVDESDQPGPSHRGWGFQQTIGIVRPLVRASDDKTEEIVHLVSPDEEDQTR